jgi:hypothetical protein
MQIRNLFEALGKEAAIIFGRFNPAHKGHRAAWETAKKSPIWYVGTNRTTVGPKDPLPFDVKIEVMKTIMPEIDGHILAETSWFTMASAVYEKHGDGITLYVVTDKTDKEWIMPTMLKQNGQQGDHGYYNFKNIEWREAPRLSSATDLRGAVMSGDRDAFSLAAGVSAETTVMGKPFFDLVAEYLLPEQEKERERQAAIAAKKSNAAAKKADLEAKRAAKLQRQQGVAEGAPIVVALPPIDVRNPKKAPQPYRNQGDIVPPTKPPSTEKRGVKGRPGQRPMPKYDEDSSNAMADTAKRLANKDDGKVAKLRAAGDKRREAELKGRNIAKKDKSSKDQWGNFKEEVVRRESFEEARMSAAAKLGKAWDAQKAKSDASRQRAKDLLNPPKPEPKKDDVKETIKKVGSQYELVSKTGKNLGKYPTKAGAEKREQQVNYFKHANEDAAGVGIITKQNTTVDVNKNTPRKNLKAFRLIK